MSRGGQLIRGGKNEPAQYFDVWEKIPADVKELLWFTNEKPRTIHHTRFNTLDFSLKNAQYNSHLLREPSTIYFILPLRVPSDFSLVKKIPYMPSYCGMNPEQRYVYLYWLRDISSEIDIGYRFLFYYGLERRLLLGDVKKSFNMIVRLRENTKNNSFLSYSANALLFGALVSDNAENLQSLRFLFNDEKWIDIQLIIKILIKEPIEPFEIPRILKAHTVNKRYLNEKLYVEQMAQLLLEKYNQSFLSKGVTDITEEDYGNDSYLVFANYLLPKRVRINKYIRLPSIDNLLMTIKELHKECHERTKYRLLRLRK